MTLRNRLLLLMGLISTSILACNFPGLVKPPGDPGLIYTAAAQTIAASVSQTLQPSLTVSIPTSVPLVTLTATLPATTSPVPETIVPAEAVTLSVSVNTNCRLGPGRAYDLVGGLLVGQVAQVYGKNATHTYWYIRLPSKPDTFCWVTGEYATVTGDVNIVPIFTPPPTPTPVPDFELSYAGMDHCTGWWTELRIKNTAPLAFRFYSLTIKDTKTGVTQTASANGFTDLKGCLSSEFTPTIEPGQTFVLSGPLFAYNFDNHKMRATLMLCTEPGGGGSCISRTIEFKP